MRPLPRLSSRLGCLRFLALCSVVRNSLSKRGLGYRSSKLRREIAKIMPGTFSIQVDQPSASAISGRIQSRCGLEADLSKKWSDADPTGSVVPFVPIRIDQLPAPAVSGRIQRHCGLEADLSRKWSGRQDLNLRPLGPQPSALPDCATPREAGMIAHAFALRKFLKSVIAGRCLAPNSHERHREPGMAVLPSPLATQKNSEHQQ